MKKDKKLRESVYLECFKGRYRRSNRENKSKLLNELSDIYGYNRKYLIQFFRGLTGKKYERKGRKRQFEPKELLAPLKKVWLATDQMCSKRLKAAIPLWLPHMEDELSDKIRIQLLTISPATIDRLLKPYRLKYKRRGLSGTKPGYLLKNQIEIKTDHWDVKVPGFMEADSVAHCGNSLGGDFIWSITLTDIATGWTENRAVWNKGAQGVLNQVTDIEKELPFPILGFDCDNGSEFLNWHLVRYFTERDGEKVQVTRSRPYRKNDNAHVEQKNWSHVRHLLGYDRFDHIQALGLINDLYSNEWSLYQNHFMPTLKLIKKEKINSKYRRQYEKLPKTPYQRLMESSSIDNEKKIELALIHQRLNPFELKITIEKKLRRIFKYATINKKPRTKI
jgi:hypothetical protein